MAFKKRALKTLIKFAAFSRWHLRLLKPRRYGDAPADVILKSLDTDGIHVCRGFFSAEEIARLNADFDAYLAAHREELVLSKALFTIDTSIHMTRWTNADKCVPAAKAYSGHPLIREVIRRFYGRDTGVDKCTYEIKLPGSHPEAAGPGAKDDMTHFHSDRPYGVFKTILLLSDVGPDDGPFHLVRGSHRIGYKAPFRRFLRMIKQIYASGYAAGLSSDEEAAFIDPSDDVACTGKAGDIFFVTTQAYHRGLVLKPGGKRVVLWNYCFNEKILGP